MNVQILYGTMSGHSRKIANALARQMGVMAQDIKQNPQIAPCDILFIVSGIYGGESSAELLSFAKTLKPQQVKKAVLLTSSAMNKAQGSLRRTLEEVGIMVDEEEYLCQGSFLIKAIGHPNKDEIANAVEFAELAKRLIQKGGVGNE